MNPDSREPWQPQPYQPPATAAPNATPTSGAVPQPTPATADIPVPPIASTPADRPEPKPWQPPTIPGGQSLPPVPPAPESLQAANSGVTAAQVPQTPTVVAQVPNQSTPPNQPNSQVPQQFGGPMAELPPLAQAPTAPPEHNLPKARSGKWLWIVLIMLIVLPVLGLGAYFGYTMLNDKSQKKIQQQQEQITYNTKELEAFAKAPTADSLKSLDKTASFYTVFKKAAQQPVVQTKWSVYYTEKVDDPRGDQYAMFDTTIDYKSKQFAYSENSVSNVGTYQIRCIDQKQYNYNDSKLTTAPSWELASDSTDCDFSIAALHFNDGVNTGGLSGEQADSFLRKVKTGADVKVSNLVLETYKEKPYLKFDVVITPKKQADGSYIGMQAFMSAFQETGLDPKTYPYNYFGPGGEGLKMTYYVDPTTQLPAYLVADSTPAYNMAGKPVEMKSWPHRYIEYAFPTKVTQPTLNDHTPIGFTTWPPAKVKQ